jgi:spore coat polysaccharide biosynthesis protein SpsF
MPLIGYVIRRAGLVLGLSRIVVATTRRTIDDPIEEYARSSGLDVFRGDTENVALRLLSCASEFGADYFVRLNGDSPFPDPSLIEEGIDICGNGGFDFVTNLIGRSFPYGISVEIVSTRAYKTAYQRMESSEEREHVTAYLYGHVDEFLTHSMTSPVPELARVRLVVDTEGDWSLFQRAVSILGEAVWTSGYKEIANLYQRMTC